jgi:hypothetical protein
MSNGSADNGQVNLPPAQQGQSPPPAPATPPATPEPDPPAELLIVRGCVVTFVLLVVAFVILASQGIG